MALFADKLNRQNLKNVHDSMNRGKIKHTFTSSNKEVRRRRDKFIYTANLQNRLIDYYIKPNTFSDHEGIILTVDLDIRKKWGKGRWKMNNEILKKDRYIKYMTEVIQKF